MAKRMGKMPYRKGMQIGTALKRNQGEELNTSSFIKTEMTKPLLIKNTTILTEAAAPLIDRGYLEIADGRIYGIGDMSEMPKHKDTLVIDGSGQLAMPGLINAHNHCAMTLFRGLADDMELATWLNEHIFPAEAAHVNEEMVYWCSKLAAAEMLLSGTTTVADGYFYSHSVARAFRDAGIRAVIGHGIIDFPAPGVPDPTRNVATVERFIDSWVDKDPLITPAVFAHSPYTCSPATLVAAKQLAAKHGVLFFIHLAESRQETGMLIDARGSSPVKHLDALGLLDSATVCVHSIWLDDEDLDVLQASGAAVVTSPQSNLKLASGTARVSHMLARGIAVGLGTDGCASNNNMDMFREMDMLAKVQKLRTLEATALPAREALSCATGAGADLLSLEDLGRLAVGHRADVILLDLKAPHLTPFYNADLLVYAAKGSDVATVIIDGKIVVHDRKILVFDLESTLSKIEQIAAGMKNTSPILS
jgi:5-methylthioadenosine/S-adenosylhomocysteine deaminase